jgi:phage baseplate assembly protein V
LIVAARSFEEAEVDERPDNGIIVGEVVELKDEEGLGRVRVKFPELNNRLSNWAPIATLMAGSNRGAFFCPEKGDHVLIAFEHNDFRRPYVVGALWSKSQPPPTNDANDKNNLRSIVSRSGHKIVLDDTSGAEKIELIDKDGQRKVVIDSANRKIQVTCDSGDVEVKAGSGSVKVEATTIEIKASGSMTLEASGSMTIKGATVNIN